MANKPSYNKDLEKKASTYWFTFFLLVSTLPPNFVLIELSLITGLNYNLFVVLIALFIIRSLYSVSKRKYPTKASRSIHISYIILLVYLIAVSPFVYNNLYFFSKLFTVIVKNLSLGIIIYVFILKRNDSVKTICEGMVKVGFLYAISSIILYFGFIIGAISLNSTYFASINETFNRGLFLGYINLVVNGIPRSQSWFTEASQLGQFLVIPLLLSFKNYTQNRNSSSILVFLSLLVGFVLTFSLANYFGLILGILIFILFRGLSSVGKISIRNLLFSVFLSVGVVYLGLYLYNQANTKVGSSVISKEADSHIMDRQSRIDFAFEVLNQNPFGDISYRESWGRYLARNRTALGSIAINAGIPGVVIVFVILIAFFYVFFSNLLRRTVNWGYLYIGFLSFFVAHWWYGDWINYTFMLNISIVLKAIWEDKIAKM